MHYVYVDEAGTKANDPVRVVAGIIVEADLQYPVVEQEIDSLLQTVPERHRRKPGFVLHAKSIFHGEEGLREDWDWTARRQLVKNLVLLPLRLRIPVCMGLARTAIPLDPGYGLSLVDHHHMIAFSLCVAHADRYVVEHGRPKEVVTLVVENIPERERFLRAAFDMLRQQGKRVPMHHVTPSEWGLAETVEYRITGVKDGPHFVSKVNGPLLWIADACAFALARYLSDGSFGADLCGPILSSPIQRFHGEKDRLLASGIVGGRIGQPNS